MEDHAVVIYLSQKDKKKGTFLFYDPFKDEHHIKVKAIFEVEFDANEKGEYIPLKIKIIKNYKEGIEKFVPHKTFYSILRKLYRVYFLVTQKDEVNPIKKMLTRYQIKSQDVLFCRFCLLDNRLSWLTEENSCNNYGEIICVNCAIKELKREMGYAGFKPNPDYLNLMRDIIIKIKDIQKIIPIFQGRFDASKHKDITLFDHQAGYVPRSKPKNVEEIKIPQELQKVLKKMGIKSFLPIQNLALENGLLNNEDLLVVSSTSTGKTLIGELAGVTKILHERKQGKPNRSLLFLNPLRVLCNQEKDRFQDRYGSLGINTAIKVGMSHINVKNEDLVIIDDNLSKADIITATYEAFDYILRQGDSKDRMREIGTIIIDEIQTLGDPERGSILDGLISRIRIFYPQAQLIGLSATVSNVQDVAGKLKLKPVLFPKDDRPVPIDRHLVFCKSETEKLFNIGRLIKAAYVRGKYGHFGTTIVFTNARSRTHQIARELKQKGIQAVAYHAGLTFFERKRIETLFEKGQTQAIITTFALGAGFDAPAYQVIFESLYMGIEELSPNMFLQMSGRAGRFKMHEKGEVYVLAEIGKSMHAGSSEDQIALNLLKSGPEELKVARNPEEVASQVLATLSAGITDLPRLQNFYDNMMYSEENLDILLKEFAKKKLVTPDLRATDLGKAVSLSFFTIDEAFTVIKELRNREDPLIISIQLEFFENIYLSSKVQGELNSIFKTRMPTKFFAATINELLFSYKKIKKKIPPWVQELLGLWHKQFFDCSCPKKGECRCGFINTNRTILDIRVEEGRTPKEISKFFKREYQLEIYSGDILRYLDGINHKLRGIARLASALKLKAVVGDIDQLIRKIENPRA